MTHLKKVLIWLIHTPYCQPSWGIPLPLPRTVIWWNLTLTSKTLLDLKTNKAQRNTDYMWCEVLKAGLLRCEQGSNLRGETPLDFKSNTLTTRSSQLIWCLIWTVIHSESRVLDSGQTYVGKILCSAATWTRDAPIKRPHIAILPTELWWYPCPSLAQ